MRFYVGLHQPSDAWHFCRAFISVSRLLARKSGFQVLDWILDSRGYSEISTHGHYRQGVKAYAAVARRWYGNGNLERIVSQDWMCEPWILQKTGLTVADHQRLTIERYDALIDEDLPVPVLPVLQGFHPIDYARHLDGYGERLTSGMWVGVGSVCKRNASPVDVANVLAEVHRARPDLLLHGFGLKITAITNPAVHALLFSADSMAWSFHARKNGRNANDWREAKQFEERVLSSAERESEPWQMTLALH